MDSRNGNNTIKEAIVGTVAYFDIFDFPLTAYEIWRFLFYQGDTSNEILPSVDLSFGSISQALDSDGLRGVLEQKDGFFFLAGRSDIVRIRMERYAIAGRKFSRALWSAHMFKLIPWIKMIALSNLMGSHNTRDGSDIDLFIITQKGRIWITRFIAVGLTKLFGWRASGNDKKDKICLTFFVSDDALDLSSYRSKTAERGLDIYFIYWMANLNILFAVDDAIAAEFWSANQWVYSYLPNWKPSGMVERRIVRTECQSFCREVVDLFLGGLDRRAGQWQMRIMAPELEKILNKDTRVIMNDRVLKMHAEDRRNEFSYRWKEALDKALDI